MSAKARQYEAELSRIVIDSGAKIVDRGMDGAGHRTLTVGMNGHRRLFHYPSTGRMCGHGILNTKARLRRILREIPDPLPAESPPPLAAAPTKPVPVPITPKPQETTSAMPARRPRRFSKEHRKEIAKRYLALPSLDALLKEFKLTRAIAETMLMSGRGQAADKLRAERERERQLRRQISNPVVAITPKEPPAITKAAVEEPALLSLHRRNKAIRQMSKDRQTVKQISAKLGLSKTRVRLIAHA